MLEPMAPIPVGTVQLVGAGRLRYRVAPKRAERSHSRQGLRAKAGWCATAWLSDILALAVAQQFSRATCDARHGWS